MTNLLNINQKRVFYVNPDEQVSTNLGDVEVDYNQVPDSVNFIQENIQVLVNNGVFVNGPVTINNTSVNIEEDSANDDNEGSLDISLNPELNLEVSLFRRFLESAPSVAIQTIVIFMLMSTLPHVNQLGEAGTNVRVKCSEINPGHSTSYDENQKLRGATVINQLVADSHLSTSVLDDTTMIVNENGTVDLEFDNDYKFNLVGYYNSHNGEFVEKATQSICK
ncbi:hypothetical protein HOJ01_01540 [bacterium]|jgi:hypothetical protein|nr:hypothetical protein [bacterium]MBT6293470.1 hypothetical protein [bacterium]